MYDEEREDSEDEEAVGTRVWMVGLPQQEKQRSGGDEEERG